MHVILILFTLLQYAFPTHGVATYYTYEKYGGNHLYCSRRTSVGGRDLRYTQDMMAKYDWVAVDVRAYESGDVKCGDMLRVCFDNAECVDVLAWDAGPFERYYIEDYPDLPILVDFEESAWPFPGLTMSAIVDVRVLEVDNARC